MARRTARTRLLVIASLLFVPLLSACGIFGGDSEDPTPTQAPPAPPAIGRTGPTPTPPPPPTPVARDQLSGLVTVVYSHPFVWPAQGPITSYMDPFHPNGIDIGLSDEAMEVRAAAGGRVVFSGGSDDEDLGLHLILDHGNGITTTYGHLAEMRVNVGDEVEIGETLGIGGSTGVSTGDHLHFEVRNDGETVDPLHVLPTQTGDTISFVVNCATTPFTLPRGSHALVDLGAALQAGQEVVDATVVSLSGGPVPQVSITGTSLVNVSTPIDFEGPAGIDSYELRMTIDNNTENFEASCAFVVERRNIPTTFYVRAQPPAEAGDEAEGDGTGDEGTETAAGDTDGDTPPAGIPDASVPSSTAPASGGAATGIPEAGAPGVNLPGSNVPQGGVPDAGVPGASVPGSGQ